MKKNDFGYKQFRLWGSIFIILFVLVACKVELYSNLSEQEANEMMGLLLRHEIPCEKAPGQEQTWILKVESSAVPVALSLFQEYGYPKPRFESMGAIFKKHGLVSSPLEERVRFIYALSQELAKTISQIDGVLAARVHIVLPENNPFTEKTIPSAASVFIKYRVDSPLKRFIPNIKALVANSIEGLNYDRVSVLLFEAETARTFQVDKIATRIFGIKLLPESVIRFWTVCGVLFLLSLIGFGFGGVMLWKWKILKQEIAHKPSKEKFDLK